MKISPKDKQTIFTIVLRHHEGCAKLNLSDAVFFHIATQLLFTSTLVSSPLMCHSVIYVYWHLAEILNLMSLIPKNEATNNCIQCISLVSVPSLEIIVIPFKEKLV